jgi:hypothetical protein
MPRTQSIKNRGLKFSLLRYAILGLLLLASVSMAEEPTRFTISPMAAPTPALKYRLLPEFIDQIPGNAAVFYGKVTAEQTSFFSSRELWDQMEIWLEMPIDALRQTDARVPFDPYYLRQAARCTTCDWQFPLREGKYFELLLPEVQQMRSFTKILNTIARIHIARGEYEDAIENFQTAFALARNVAAGETVVNGLVGIAASRIVYHQLMDFVQQPDAPNMYWALTMMPQPLVAIHSGVEAELSTFELSYPKWKDWDTNEFSKKEFSKDEWREILYGLCEYMSALSNDDEILGSADELYRDMIAESKSARQALVKNHEQTARNVEAMTNEQAVALHVLRVIKARQQDVAKHFHLPYPQARDGMFAAMSQFEDPPNQVLMLFDKIGSPLLHIRKAIVRNSRSLAVLRIIEALRIYSAAHEGQLPEQLSEVTEVPIPLNPVSGEAFEYKLTDGVATLSGATVDWVPYSYEIVMKEPETP